MIHTWMWVALACAAICPAAWSQTLVDLRSQGRNIDFSSATLTKPFKTGTTLPAVCTAGETFFKTNAAQGQNIYVCSSTNTWATSGAVVTSNSGPGGVEILKAQAGAQVVGRQTLPGEGIVLGQQTDTVTMEVDTAVVPRYAVSTSAPTGACDSGRDLYTRTGGFPNFHTCVAGVWKPVWEVAASTPSTCYVGELLYHTTNQAIYGCTATDTWSRLTDNGGVDLSTAGDCFITTSCAPSPIQGRNALAAGAAAGSFAAIRIVIRDRVKLGKGLIYATSGGATSAFTAALYQDNNGVPGSKIPDTDLRFVNLAAAGFRQATWGNGAVVLTPKIYWVGFSSEDAATQYGLPGGVFGSIAFMEGTLGVKPGYVNCSNLVNGSGSSYELPDACGTPTAGLSFSSDIPIVLASAQ